MIRHAPRRALDPTGHDLRSDRAHGEEGGFILPWFALMLIVLVAMAGFGVDVWNWWYTGQKAQRAADAGALAGAPFMPNDFARATTTAQAASAANGYTIPAGNVEKTAKAAQIKVTVSTTVSNSFTTLLGMATTSITRSAVAEYQAPVPLGSPTNNVCNQPSNASLGPQWLATGAPAKQNTDPQCWSQDAGSGNTKDNGDEFASGKCNSGNYNPGDTNNLCSATGNANNEAANTPNGYYDVVRVRATAADIGKSLAIQLYDPAFVQTGNNCDDFDTTNTNDEASFNTAMTNVANAAGKPEWNPADVNHEKYCPGDHYVSGTASSNPTYTFSVKNYDGTYSPDDNTAVSDASCSQTFAPITGAAYNAAGSLPNLLAAGNSSAQGLYAKKVYHQWVTLCDMTLSSLNITSAGNYDILINIKNSAGNGHNRYAARAALRTGSSYDGTDVSMFALDHQPMYQNFGGANTLFYLAQLQPGSDGRQLQVQFYDVGDVSQAGTLQVLPPTEATKAGGVALTSWGCTYSPDSGSISQDSSTCTLTNVSSAYNGRLITASIPIPAGYSCNSASAYGCWVQVKMVYPSQTSDTTTWGATIKGDPDRLVQ